MSSQYKTERLVRQKLVKGSSGKVPVLKALVEEADADGDGYLSVDEWRGILRSRKLCLGLTPWEVDFVIDRIDPQKTGSIPFESLAAFMNFIDADDEIQKPLGEDHGEGPPGDADSPERQAPDSAPKKPGHADGLQVLVSSLKSSAADSDAQRIVRRIYEKLRMQARSVGKVMNAYDEDEDGYITHVSFLRGLRALNVSVSSGDVQFLVELLDPHMCGYINIADFSLLFGGTNMWVPFSLLMRMWACRLYRRLTRSLQTGIPEMWRAALEENRCSNTQKCRPISLKRRSLMSRFCENWPMGYPVKRTARLF